MKNHELITRLQTLPQDAEVYKDVAIGGCNDCNPESITCCEDPEPRYYDIGPYPYHKDRNMIIL